MGEAGYNARGGSNPYSSALAAGRLGAFRGNRTGGTDKRQALRECATSSSEGLNNETGAAWRKAPGLGHRNTYVLPRLGYPQTEGPGLSEFPRIVIGGNWVNKG